MAEISKPDYLSLTWARTGDKREPSNTKKDLGWVEEVPTYQDFNWLDNKQDTAIAHINQHGIAVWDTTTEYTINRSYVQGSDGNIYYCKATNTNVNPVTDTSETSWILRLVGADKSKPAVVLTVSGSWANISTALIAKVSSGVLQIQGNITGGTTTADTVIATLPATYRPSVARFASGIFQTGVYTYGNCSIQIATNGQISIRGVTSSTNLYISIAVQL